MVRGFATDQFSGSPRRFGKNIQTINRGIRAITIPMTSFEV